MEATELQFFASIYFFYFYNDLNYQNISLDQGSSRNKQKKNIN
jgi:hypothetical protein